MMLNFMMMNNSSITSTAHGYSVFCSTMLLIILILPSTSNFSFVLGSDITGTNIPNTIYGTMSDDNILGKDGKDNLYGNGGNDIIHGENGDDFVDGGPGKDSLEGNDGNDVVQGGAGADRIDGGKGNDTLIASFALGSVSFRDYAVDTIVCGSGFDTAYISSVDGDSAATDCEEIITETGQ
jgi:Ca2+-binding RTX toxin-like protein